MKSSIIILIVALATINALPISIPRIPTFPDWDSETTADPDDIPFGLPQIPGGVLEGTTGSIGNNQNESEDSDDSEEKNSKVNLNIYMNGGSGSRAAEASSNSVVVNFNFNENKEEKEESAEIVEPEFTITGSPVNNVPRISLPGIPALGGYKHYPLQ
ncbi:unnamed protein product [Caenorhabditis angaria]|uniref:Uncharacterized protein n=1 Tax=Caenorhabditis angaria TaxID=860376 RepID=A0A9P1NCB8_9PELO|nr:unnamed protein product [Caenorhabditis angaria]